MFKKKPKQKTDEELAEEARLEEGRRLNQIMFPELIQNRFNEIKVNDMWSRVVSAGGYPRSVSDGWLDKLVSMSGDFDMAIHVQPLELNHVLNMLNRELKKQASDINTLTKKGEIPPTSLQIQNEDTKNVLKLIQKGEERMFNVSIYVSPKAETLDDLELLTKRVKATLNSVLIVPKITSMRMLDGLRSILPLSQDRLRITRNITSSALAACFPFTTSGLKIEEDGVLFGVNANNRIPVIIDPFNLNNPNGLVLATSGAGKSFFVKVFEIRQRLQNVNVINLDPQGEYTKLTEAYGGQSIKISKDSDTVVNPFDMMGMDYVDKIASLHSFMHTIVEDVTSPQQALLDDAFRRVYIEAGITEEKSTWSNEPPTFSDLYSVIKEKEDDDNHLTRASAMALTNRLRMFTEGSLSFLNRQTQLDFDNRLVTFDISRVPKMAKPAMMYTILEYVIHKMKNDIKRKIFVIDEAWFLLQYPEAADRIFEIVKTSRKYNMSFIIITQEVNDLLNSRAGNSVLANTSWKLLLRQEPSVIDSISKTFKLNYAETMMLMTAQPGDGILFAYNNHIPLKIIASKLEYDLVTTRPDDLLQKEPVKDKPAPIVQKRFRVTKKVQLKNELTGGQVDILRREGFKEVRDSGFMKGMGSSYLVKNDTGETDAHFVLWNLIYDEVRKYTDKVAYNLTKEPDIVFTAKDGRTIAIEVEAVKKPELDLGSKLSVLQKYDEWFFVVVNKDDKDYYRRFGETLTRVTVQEKIRPYFLESKPPESQMNPSGGESRLD